MSDLKRASWSLGLEVDLELDAWRLDSAYEEEDDPFVRLDEAR